MTIPNNKNGVSEFFHPTWGFCLETCQCLRIILIQIWHPNSSFRSLGMMRKEFSALAQVVMIIPRKLRPKLIFTQGKKREIRMLIFGGVTERKLILEA